MEYMIDLEAKITSPATEDALNRFLTSLENEVIAPIVSYNTPAQLLSARFITSGKSAFQAAESAREAFCSAMDEADLPALIDFTEVHVVVETEREDAATFV